MNIMLTIILNRIHNIALTLKLSKRGAAKRALNPQRINSGSLGFSSEGLGFSSDGLGLGSEALVFSSEGLSFCSKSLGFSIGRIGGIERMGACPPSSV